MVDSIYKSSLEMMCLRKAVNDREIIKFTESGLTYKMIFLAFLYMVNAYNRTY